MNDLIRFYFTLGLKQLEIRCCLASNHNIFISERTLKRKLSKMNLYRRKHFSSINEIYSFIENCVQFHSKLHGYKWIHLKCLQNNIVVTQEIVRILLQIIDPVGVELRARRRLRRRQYHNKGPNFLWHMDCYDKLKPYGICISGCIDGFSRNIIWLKAGSNSNDPKIIAGYYLDSISSLGGSPQTIRADLGTENGVVKNLQTFLMEQLRANETNSDLPTFLYGTSQMNQRIEAWWSQLRKHHGQFYLNLFQGLKDEGLFSGSFLDKSLIQFCFMKIIQDELNVVVMEWGLHNISSSRNSVCPKGRPFIMYHMPEVYGTKDYLNHLPEEILNECRQFCLFPNEDIPCDSDVYNLATLIMAERGLTLPVNCDESIELYIFLRSEMLTFL